MICIDYKYYLNNYGGVEMPQAKFTALELRATKYINKLAFNRIDFENIDALGEETEENIKLAVCATIEILHKHMNNGNRVISSEKVGDNSITYAVANEASVSKEKEIYKEVKLYLGNTGLLYRGIEHAN